MQRTSRKSKPASIKTLCPTIGSCYALLFVDEINSCFSLQNSCQIYFRYQIYLHYYTVSKISLPVLTRAIPWAYYCWTGNEMRERKYVHT